MKSEIDNLMAEDQIDLLWVTGSAINNPAMMYVTGGGHITKADFIKKRGGIRCSFLFSDGKG